MKEKEMEEEETKILNGTPLQTISFNKWLLIWLTYLFSLAFFELVEIYMLAHFCHMHTFILR